METKTQCENILAWLKRGYALTPLDALKHFGCFRLGARIWDLKQEGYNISTTLRFIDGKRFAEYHLVKVRS